MCQYSTKSILDNSTTKGDLNMKLLKSLIFGAMIALTTVAHADDKPVLDVIIASGNGSNTWGEGNMLRDALVAQGYDSEIVWTRNCFNTYDYYSRVTDRPAIFIRSGTRYIKDTQENCIFETNENTFVMPLYLRLQTMCVNNDSDFDNIDQFLEGKDRVTIATSSTIPPNFYDDLSDQTGVEFRRVDYDGGSKVLAGLISGDTDLMYSSYTLREKNHQDVTCFATSATKEVDGLPTLSSLFPEWGNAGLTHYKYVHAVNLPVERMEEVRETFSTIIDTDKKVAPYIRNASMIPGTEMTENGLANFMRSVEQWKSE